MEETKLTVRVPKRALAGAKKYAARNNTTLTRLITVYLEKLESIQPAENRELSPAVQRLLGSLSPEVTVEDYHRYLEEKYLGPDADTD